MMKSLKNKLNDDNKKSQGMIGKMKKSYEELQKKIEGLNIKYGECRNLLDGFEETFVTTQD